MSRVERGDARLMDAAVRMAGSFVNAELNGTKPGGMEAQKEGLYGMYAQAFMAIANTVKRGRRDILGLWRSARKARAIREGEKW